MAILSDCLWLLELVLSDVVGMVTTGVGWLVVIVLSDIVGTATTGVGWLVSRGPSVVIGAGASVGIIVGGSVGSGWTVVSVSVATSVWRKPQASMSR